MFCAFLSTLTFPTKVPSDSLGRIGRLKRTSDKSLFPMALGSCGHRITHQLRPINMNGRSILSETSTLAPFLRVHWPQFSRHSPLATRHSPLPPTTLPRWILLATDLRIDKDRTEHDLDDRPLFIQYVTESGDPFGQIKFSWSLASWCRQVKWEAAIFGGRRPCQFAHGCAPTDKRLRGDFLVERNSFRFSVPLVPFERANRSAGKKRKEFRSTAPKPRVLGKGQSWLKVRAPTGERPTNFSPRSPPPNRGAEGQPTFWHQGNVAPW